ncbi:MAG: TetR/AcrR family transcriptional regulator [Rhodocyclales bacterium]|nr:TetR/AcrR family transcriptional regulator [Rhodocyclales bacterium]
MPAADVSLPVSDQPAALPRQRRKEARPAELTTAALELFITNGYAATRLEDIAAHAGVSKGTLYLYFESKEALFKAVIREGIVPVMAQGAELIDGFSGCSADLLRHLILAWWQRVGETPLGGVPKLMMSEAGNFPEVAAYYAEAVITPGRDLLRRVLVRGMVQGEFRALDVETAIDVIFAPVLMLLIWRHSMGACGCRTHEPQAFLATHLDLVLNGLAADIVAAA